MKPELQERGQALILIVFAAVGLFAFAALAIDGSRVFSDRRHAQNAADTAVMAAALAKIRAIPPADPNGAAETAGLARADSNGFDNNGTTNWVEVNPCDTPALDPPCEGLPADANPAEYIQVMIRLNTPTTFARVIGFNQVPSVVTAVARASGSSAISSAFSNAALFATQRESIHPCFEMQGGGGGGGGGGGLVLNTWGSGIYVNCIGSQTVTLGGSADLNMEDDGQVVGCYVTNGAFTTDPIQCGANGGVPRVYNAGSFASVPTTLPPPTCSGAGSFDVATNSYSPGSFSSLVVTSNASMNPGVYCVSGGISLIGSSLTGSAGTVKIVLQDSGITLIGNSVMDFTDLEIYGNNANLTIPNTGTALRADRLRFFSTGTGTVDLGGGAELSSGNAYFYFYRGNIGWNGGSILNLHGPPQGDQFGGLLIHKPWDNHTDVLINGGANIDLTGTFMVPGSFVRINGDADFDLHSQIIGSTFQVSGSSQVDIYYDPTENYTPPNSPMIQLTK